MDERDAQLQRQISEEERGTWRERLRADYAPWFDELFWGFQVGAGWRGIILDLTEEIARIVSNADMAPAVRVVQVKEKYGALRFYVRDVPEIHRGAVAAAIERAEQRSMTVCERCGEPGRLRETEESYWYTACDAHVLE